MTSTKTFSESSEILQILKKNNIQSLWHFTDIRNLPLIKKLNGLKSKKFLEEKGYLGRIICGGNQLSHELDKNLGNWDKVSLNFTSHVPMAYHKKRDSHLIFIEIDPIVATFEDVHFTDCNATRIRNGQKKAKGLKGLSSIRFDIINGLPKPYDPNWQKFVQAEVLIPHQIPLNYFKKIHFISKASLQLGLYLWEEMTSLFTVSPKVFADYDHTRGWVIINPYVENVVITLEEITKENVNSNHPEAKYITIGKKFWIKVSLFATAGSKAKVILRDLTSNIIDQKEIEFETESEWWWFPSFQIPERYYQSEIILEIILDEILWCKEKRKVLT